MQRKTYKITTLFVVLSVSALWCAFARWHVGWAIFFLTCVPAALLAISILRSARLRVAKTCLLVPCLCLIYAYSLPPFDVALRWSTGATKTESQSNLEIWNVYTLPLSHFQKTPLGDRVLRIMLSEYFEAWNAREGYT